MSRERGFISGRYILDNVLWLKEAKWSAAHTQTPSVFLSLDFAKAYDSVRWEFLLAALRHYGFGENFIKWINILLCEAGARVIVNGTLTEWVKLGRSVRQGDPLAPALYVILTDFLIYRIKQDPRVRGVLDPWGNEHKISGLADDMMLALLPLAGSIEAALEILMDFSLVSGCLLNWEKTKVICVCLTATPACLSHIQRISGQEFHIYLGLPYQEGEENQETGRPALDL